MNYNKVIEGGAYEYLAITGTEWKNPMPNLLNRKNKIHKQMRVVYFC